MSKGAQQLDELYNQLLNSFDSDGPDLELISPVLSRSGSANGMSSTPPPPRSSSRPPPPRRKDTTDSEQLLDLYQSYVDNAEAPAVTKNDSAHAVQNNPLNISVQPRSTMDRTSSNNWGASPPTSAGSTRSSRPLPMPPMASTSPRSSTSTGPTPQVPQVQQSYDPYSSQQQQQQPVPGSDRTPTHGFNGQYARGSSPDSSGASGYRANDYFTDTSQSDLSPVTPFQTPNAGAKVMVARALSASSGNINANRHEHSNSYHQQQQQSPPPMPSNNSRPSSHNSTGSYYTTQPGANNNGYTQYNNGNISDFDAPPPNPHRAASSYVPGSGAPPLPPKPTAPQHSVSYSVGQTSVNTTHTNTTHSSSPSISVTPSSETDFSSFSSESVRSRGTDRDTTRSSITSVGAPTVPKSPQYERRQGAYIASSPTPTAHPASPPDTWAQQYPASDLERERDRGEYDFVEYTDNDGADAFSLASSSASDSANTFFNSSLLSHISVKLRDKVPRETHVKGSIPYANAFTGKDIVSTIQSVIARDIPDIASDGRRTALSVARSLQKQLFFNEVEWESRELVDGVEDVYMFMDDQLNADQGVGGSSSQAMVEEREELPNGIILPLTKCYVSTCAEGEAPCYAWSCPRKTRPSLSRLASDRITESTDIDERAWADGIDQQILAAVPQSEKNRQSVIFRTISQEAKYLKDLDLIDSLFVKPLRLASPPIIDASELDSFIECVFGNILDLRETNRRILDKLYVRQREQGPFIQYIGDIFLTAATEFRVVYPKYVGNLVRAGQRVKDELEGNARFRAFHDECVRLPEARRLDLRRLITRPSEHLQRYPVLLEAIRTETMEGNPDAEYLLEASEAIRKLSTMAQLRAFQVSMLKGPAADTEWHTLVAADVRDRLNKHEIKRQLVIFELIKSEMEYVRDLEMIQSLFIRPLRAAKLPLPDPSERGVDDFLRDIFHNYEEILEHQRRLLAAFFEIQSEEYPCVHSIVAPIFDAALNWQDAYMEYTAHYPIAEYRVEEAMSMPEFRAVVEEAQRNPEARKLNLKSFINRPISRILRYDLLLKRILGETPENHEDQKSIPEVLPIVRDLNKAMDHAIVAPKRKVEMWRYHRNLVWRPGEEMNLDLLDETRTLVHTGRLLRQPEGGFELGGWTELFVLLFDNYLVMTKAKEKDGIVKYHVNRRPIPLELLTVLSFNDAPIQRGSSLLSGLRGGGRNQSQQENAYSREPAEPVDHRLVYPCSVYHSGRVGGHYQIFAESDKVRAEWKQKLDEAIGLRKVVLENNKVFEQTTISADTFIVPSLSVSTPSSSSTWNEGQFTGRVTCSIPLKAANGRDLVAVGCGEGVWIGLRHDSTSMRRVLHLKHVTQCAMLEDFGIFLVLADKYLFAYHIEALVPTGPPGPNSQREPQRLNRNRDVQFFSVGTLNDRTLIIYMKKKGLDSVFRVLEPVTEKIAEKTKATTFGRNIFGTQKSEWFREYKEFFLPSEAYDLIFLKLRVAILCAKGFEIMDLVEFNSVTIPQRDDPRHIAIAKRCESRRPMGMFRSAENEFLLCYDEFGVYVDRHGDSTNRQVGVIEWEGTAERVAFHPPYVLIFDTRFIEIRHISQGKLVQIIQGTDVHCTWDGRGSLSRLNQGRLPTTPGPGGWDESNPGEARIHAVMKAEGTAPTRGTVAQHVFELTPTQLLYNPPSLQPQNSSSYFHAPPRPASSSAPTIRTTGRPSSGGAGW